MTVRRAAAAAGAVVTVLAGCGSAPPAAPETSLPQDLAARITIDAMRTHLQRFSEIAHDHGGNRADGTPGHQASVDYVVGLLRDKGFEVRTEELRRLDTVSAGAPTLVVGARTFQVDQASLLLPTPAGGTTGRVFTPRVAAGCSAGDYPSAVKGGIAVVDDTRCSVVDKHDAAAQRGAAALVVISAGGRTASQPGLFPRGYYEPMTIPVAVAGAEAGSALRRTSTPVRVVLDAKSVLVRSQNVLAQTRTGATTDIVLVGAHLDSVAAGPGINDNASGVAAVLETALQLGARPKVANAVRFAFWGAEEKNLAGSADHVYGLSGDELNSIALYLNFDMLGSPNAGYFTYDGDQSARADAEPVPIGSEGIERTLASYLNLAGRRPADLPLTQRSDYQSFLAAGIPVGGMTTGADGRKTTVQARLWGGDAGVAFDPNYHTARDDLEAVNEDALAVMGSGAAFAVGTYAVSIEGANGVPVHAKRHRRALGP
ncbi:M28 family peptidase [Mycobacterium sp. ACS4331]|uniref:M28 family peptidase n=1 Tax=Mycobacterium sp. ACS4331 TaxID=1834121 RepID=UPI0007FED7F9|nr:M28 family peptidase [Mycobacterium sp. ACS4331]OBF13026.1 peptidase M28 [Mycobacterium sp. ACS4331]